MIVRPSAVRLVRDVRASRRAIDRPSSDSRPWELWPMARNGSPGVSSCSARYASSAATITAVFVVRTAVGEAVEPFEQVGVGQDRGSSGRHMRAYMTRWRARVNPCDHARTSRPDAAAGGSRGPLRTEPAHPRPDRPSADRPRGRRAPDDQPSRTRVRGDARSHPDRDAALFRDDERYRDRVRRRDRRSRGRGREHASRRATASWPSRSASFGDRFAKIARTYGADVTKIDVEWGQAADPATLRAELERDNGYAGRPAHPQRDVDLGDEPDPRARRGRPRARSRRAHPRRQRVGARRRPLRDGRLGRRRRRHRLAEGLDVGTGPGDDRGVAPRLDRDGVLEDASLLPRPAGAIATPHANGQTPWTPALAVALPGRRGDPPDDRGRSRPRLRPPRGVRRSDEGRSDGPRASSSSPTRGSRRGPSPARASPRTSTGRRSTPTSSGAVSSSPAARASSPARSSGSDTSDRSLSRRSSAR